MYKCILFDMDGTLVNTYQGIHNSYRYAFEKMNMVFPGSEFVDMVIGAPLLSVFRNRIMLSEPEAIKAVDFYRKYYASKGKAETVLYDGIDQMLVNLKKKQYYLGVATLKRENFAKEILYEQGLYQYFDVVCGIDGRDRLSKTDLLKKCMKKIGVKNTETILVGDSEYDFVGAKEAGIDFMGVTYGFGFRKNGKVMLGNEVMIANTALEISTLLCDTTRE